MDASWNQVNFVNAVVGGLAALGTLFAAIYAARAAASSAQQTRLQGQSLAAEGHHREWLSRELPRLVQSSVLQVPHGEEASAVFWLEKGVLEWVPAESSGQLCVKMKKP